MTSDRTSDRTSGETWNHEWRANISAQVNEGAKALQAAALALERVNGRLDDHDRRIEVLESQPANTRATLTGYGGLIFQAVFACLSLTAIIISLVAHITFH